MAKLKAPLLSLGASGKLGGALVFFNWKGINVVREYVVPTNPDTPLQQVQRGYLRDAVAAIHAAQAEPASPLDIDDQVAYANLANAQGKVMTWFNMVCKLWLDVKRAGFGPAQYRDGHISDTDKDDFRPIVLIDEEPPIVMVAGRFYLGTTRTSLVHSEPATVVPGVSAALGPAAGFSGLTAGKKYFWQFRPIGADPCEGADTGIYYDYAT